MVFQKLVAAGAVQGLQQGNKFIVDQLGYDFLGLASKIFIFYAVALIIDKLHFLIIGAGGFWADILGFFGVDIPKNEPNFLTKLFSDDGVQGIHYWQLINFIVMALTIISMVFYLNEQKQKNLKPNPFTVAIFGLILFLLSAFTLPQLMNKLKNRVSSQNLFGGK